MGAFHWCEGTLEPQCSGEGLRDQALIEVSQGAVSTDGISCSKSIPS
uniref:Predicted protein n=1 Tax=Hordeum vulgare subsp. vulgare TaxID=112509 RepID=F2D3E5_HORVV|nr:predicted protein [Hordeum vulgare subsp. vulgare]